MHTPPEVKDYIESVNPDSVPHKWVDGGKFFEVDTTASGSVVTARPEVVIPTEEKRRFSYWVVKPNPYCPCVKIHDRALPVFQGEFGIVGLVFGVERPRIQWPQLGPKQGWPDLWVHMREHLPPGGGPDPGPGGRDIRTGA
jgi:hypothetical protein